MSAITSTDTNVKRDLQALAQQARAINEHIVLFGVEGDIVFPVYSATGALTPLRIALLMSWCRDASSNCMLGDPTQVFPTSGSQSYVCGCKAAAIAVVAGMDVSAAFNAALALLTGGK